MFHFSTFVASSIGENLLSHSVVERFRYSSIMVPENYANIISYFINGALAKTTYVTKNDTMVPNLYGNNFKVPNLLKLVIRYLNLLSKLQQVHLQ